MQNIWPWNWHRKLSPLKVSCNFRDIFEKVQGQILKLSLKDDKSEFTFFVIVNYLTHFIIILSYLDATLLNTLKRQIKTVDIASQCYKVLWNFRRRFREKFTEFAVERSFIKKFTSHPRTTCSSSLWLNNIGQWETLQPSHLKFSKETHVAYRNRSSTFTQVSGYCFPRSGRAAAECWDVDAVRHRAFIILITLASLPPGDTSTTLYAMKLLATTFLLDRKLAVYISQTWSPGTWVPLSSPAHL